MPYALHAKSSQWYNAANGNGIQYFPADFKNIGSGVILTSPNGNCWRMTVSDAGAQVITSITCP